MMRALVCSLLLLPAAAQRRIIRKDANVRRNQETRRVSTTLPVPELPEDHEVHNFPGMPSGFSTKHFAGGLPVNDGSTGYLFYWLFECSTAPETKPLLIWINGGPGCSSMEGLFEENGPFKINADGHTLSTNPHSWHNAANVLFIDQPIGTGLSFVRSGGTVRGQSDVDEHLHYFLQKFLNLHANYVTTNGHGHRVSREVLIFGESYAGHYIPSFAAHTLNQNKDLGDRIEINLVALGIGNGWTHPFYQVCLCSLPSLLTCSVSCANSTVWRILHTV
jgi:carboxypeptidase C (cathepsin A)